MLSWMMGEFIHWSKPYLLLSATCGETLSWMIEFSMTKHLVGDTVILYSRKNLQGMTNNVGSSYCQ